MDYQITNVHIAKVWHLLLVITNRTVPENSSRCSKQHLWRICLNTQVIYSIYIYIYKYIYTVTTHNISRGTNTSTGLFIKL
jgi:hypothetical protein